MVITVLILAISTKFFACSEFFGRDAMQKILVVDDNRMVLNSLASYVKCKFRDYDVLTAEDGKQAIETLESNPVCLVLTDLEMPNVDGYRIIEYAKKNHPSLPVIIMTGSWSLDLRMLVCKTGIARCIEKPFRFDDLSLMISEALGLSSKPSALITAMEMDNAKNIRGRA
jgi:DNA-binding NtrC family response regulator